MKFSLDQRLIDFLDSRGIHKNGIQDFLFPKINKMNNPYDLNNMQEAVKKIKDAIASNKRILVFGDYDCDGISAAAILVLYLKSKGARVSAFIPNRFDDGYGLSKDTIKEFCSNGKPDLVITVDLGITAVAEVEELKSRGIDVIVTDHHEPCEELPKCTVIDAKVPGQKYSFNGLCGAGVALKLVEALENRSYITKYLDICSIATIGDIVPLVDENRIIAKLGLEKINSGNCLPSIKFLLNKLSLETISSEDVSFKIVPKLNASGRMDKGQKVLDFLIETDEKRLEELYVSIDADNEQRLYEIATGNQKVTDQLKNIDLTNYPAILVKGDFHQGVLGILASRVCHDYNRPTIVFTETEEGTYKGSGRSVGNIDIHGILSSMSDLFVRFGGHKMAIGLEITKENYDKFYQLFNQKLKETTLPNDYEIHDEYDIEIFENDINLKFIKELKMLEPFGCENEKPILMLKADKLVVEQMRGKNYKHYKIFTKSGKQIVAFAASKYVEHLKSDNTKQLFVDLDISNYGGKTLPNCKLISVKFDDKTFDFSNEIASASAIINRYLSINNKNIINCNHYSTDKLIKKAEELASNKFGTIIICQSQEMLDKLLESDIIVNNYQLCERPMSNKHNCIVLKSAGLQEYIYGYNNYIFMNTYLRREHLFFKNNCNVYDQMINSDYKIKVDRKIMSICYKTIQNNCKNIYANDIFELAQKLCYLSSGIQLSQMLLAILTFAEIGVIAINSITDPKIDVIYGAKSNLDKSRLYKELT